MEYNLLCRVGDTVYAIAKSINLSSSPKFEVVPLRVLRCGFDKFGFYIQTSNDLFYNSIRRIYNKFAFFDMNQDVFLTEEEAMLKLQEITDEC